MPGTWHLIRRDRHELSNSLQLVLRVIRRSIALIPVFASWYKVHVLIEYCAPKLLLVQSSDLPSLSVPCGRDHMDRLPAKDSDDLLQEEVRPVSVCDSSDSVEVRGPRGTHSPMTPP